MPRVPLAARLALACLLLGGCGDGALDPADAPTPSTAPTVQIAFPFEEDVFLVGEIFEIQVALDDDAPTAELALTWTASDDGRLTGEPYPRGDLLALAVSLRRPGHQDLTVTATDADGEVGEATVGVEIREDQPPVLTFLAPTPGDSYAVGDSIPVRLLVQDEFVTEVALEWYDAAENAGADVFPGEDGVVEFTLDGLGPGVHPVLVQATDRIGLRETAEVDVVVE